MSDKTNLQAAGIHERDLVDSKALEVTVKRLAELSALNLKKKDLADRPKVYENRIDLPELFKTPQVVYFYLSGSQEPKTVSMIGKLALFTLLSAAAQAEEGQRKQVYIIADEFQRLVSQSLEIFFEQARSMRLAFILANHDLSQLKSKGADVATLVETCTAYKQIFTAQDLDSMLRMEQLSGEALYHQATWQELIDDRVDATVDGVFALSNAADAIPQKLALVSVRESEGPRLERNTLIEVSADTFGSFVRFTQNSGFTRFSGYITPIITEYHTSQEEYQARAKTPWPKPGFETFDLQLMSCAPDGAGFPVEGKRLVIVAAVGKVLNFRIFNGEGKKVVDTDEKKVVGAEEKKRKEARHKQIEDLKKQLDGLWPPHELTRSEEESVISAVTTIVGHLYFETITVTVEEVKPVKGPFIVKSGAEAKGPADAYELGDAIDRLNRA